MMALHPGSSSGARVYVGDLPKDASEEELERVFKAYGPLRDVWIARNPPGFAFVSFENLEDAEEAVKALNGSTICGVRARVEHSSEPFRGRSQPLPPVIGPPLPASSRPFPPPVFPYPPIDPFVAGRPDVDFWRRHFQTMLPFLMGKPSPAKIYVGDLPKDASEKELQRIFSVYGPLRDVWVARNPPGFAFIEFVSFQDAEDAVQKLNGTIICGQRVRVEHSTERPRSRGPPIDERILMDFRPPFDLPYLRPPWPEFPIEPREEDGVPSKVFVGNLPKDANRRELEVVFRLFGPLRDVWVARNPPGFAFVEFYNYRDADEAVHRMDGELICGVRVRVEHSNSVVDGEDRQRVEKRSRRPASRHRTRSYSLSRSRSRARSPTRSRTNTRSRSRRSRTRSRTHSRSFRRHRSKRRRRRRVRSKSTSSSSSSDSRSLPPVRKASSSRSRSSSGSLLRARRRSKSRSRTRSWSRSSSRSRRRVRSGDKRSSRGGTKDLRETGSSSRVYVGGISKYTSALELEGVFRDYGPLVDVWVARNPPGFAFVDFRNHRDAEAAVRALDGTLVFGRHIRVEHSTKRSRPGGSSGGGGGRVHSPRDTEDGEVDSSISGSRSNRRSLSNSPCMRSHCHCDRPHPNP